MNAIHRSCSSRRSNAVGTLAGLCAVLVPVAVFAADVPASVTAAPAPAAAPAVAAPAPAVAPAPTNTPLNSVLDNSPYVPDGYKDPVQNAPIARNGPSPVVNVQYKGYSIEGDTTYYIVADTRSGQSHWLKLGETWNIPSTTATGSAGYVTLSQVPNNGQSIMVDTSARQGITIDMYKNDGKPVPMLATATNPNVVLSTDTLGRGGRRGGGGGGLALGFAGGVDHGVDHSFADAGVFEGNDLVGRQLITGAGVLNLADNQRVTHMRLRHGLHFCETRSWWRRRRGHRVGPGDATGQQEAGERKQQLILHVHNSCSFTIKRVYAQLLILPFPQHDWGSFSLA